MEFLISLLIIFTPLVYDRSFYNPYELPKFILIVLGAWVLAVIEAFLVYKNKKRVKSLNYLSVLVLIYTAIVFLADILGVNWLNSIKGSYWRHQGFLLLLSGVVIYFLIFFNRERDGFFKKVIIVSNFLVAGFGFWDGVKLNILKDFGVANYQGRIVGTMGSPIFLSGYLIITLPFLLLLKNKFLAFILFLINLIVLFWTDTKASLITLFLLAAIYLWQKLVNRFFKHKILAWVFLGVIFLTSFIYLTKGFILFDDYLQSESCKKSSNMNYDRSKNIVYCLLFADIENERYSANRFLNKILWWVNRGSIWENRGVVWVEGIRKAFKKPVLGYGQENFMLVFPEGKHVDTDNSHNLFLETVLSSGFLGLFVFVLIFIVAFWKASLVVKLSLIAFLVRGQFNPLSVSEIMIFWVLIGLK